MRTRGIVTVLLCLVALPARAAPKVPIELLTLDMMREKNIITQAEYDSAVRDLQESVGLKAGETFSLVIGKWSTTLYGFVQDDNIWDSTQSFNDLAGNAQVARSDTYAGQHDRYTMSVRNSRIGFRLRAPEFHHIRASAQLEMDFLGNQPPTATEVQFFTSATFRIRHMLLKIETPVVDLMFGQYWQLVGWGPLYQPHTLQIQGVPSELYSRAPQIRLSKTIATAPVNIEAVIAMVWPPQRDSATPQGQLGVRIAINKWVSRQTYGQTSTVEKSPLSFAFTSFVDHFELPQFAAKPMSSVPKIGWGVAGDAWVPIIPSSLLNRIGSLGANAEYAYSYGGADLYTGEAGGVSNPALPNPTMITPAPTYAPDIDPGLVVFDAARNAHIINWQTWLFGGQYYFPKLDGRLWIAGNYSHQQSNNAFLHGAPTATRKSLDWFDVLVAGDPTPAVRLGVEYSWFADTYADGQQPRNHRVQVNAFYIF